jgi:hypothetical protein
MAQETYRDAIYFFREGKKNHDQKGGPFVIWRNLRAAIAFSFLAIEACVNQFIDSYVDQNRTELKQSDIDYWTEKDGYVRIQKKLSDGVKFYGGASFREDTALWSDFEELRDLRDEILHPKIQGSIFANTDTSELLKKTEKGVVTAGAVIKKLYLGHPSKPTCPPVFDTPP